MSDTSRPPRLLLDAMESRHPGLTREIAAYYRQAAHVCLDRHHQSPAVFAVCDRETADVEVIWSATTGQVKAAWANAIDATEAGAYACALAAVQLARGHVAVRRAETGTGADYYIGPPGSGRDDLEDCVRLEVSGVDRGNRQRLDARLADKTKQARAGASRCPAVAAVVGFEAKTIVLSDVAEIP